MLASIACASLTPAGFWTTYRPESIKAQFSDQGPWGGHRWLYWEAGLQKRLTLQDATAFAASHGWSCEPAALYLQSQIRTWRYMSRPVFPFLADNDGRSPITDASVVDHPLHFDSDSAIARCASGWMRVRPGDGDATPAYGYLQVSVDGTRMAVYHHWGEV